MKLLFTGAQGTGKTTILDHFKNDPAYNVITEVVRNLSKEGVAINEDGDAEGQEKIFNEYKRLLEADDDSKIVVSDRSFIDVLAYTAYLYHHKPSDALADLFLEQYIYTATYFKEHNDVMVYYFPIEFDLVGDGVRSMNNSFRNEIDTYISMFANAMVSHENLVRVSGSVNERMSQILDSIKTL